MSAKIIIVIQTEHFELQKSAVVIRTGSWESTHKKARTKYLYLWEGVDW